MALLARAPGMTRPAGDRLDDQTTAQGLPVTGPAHRVDTIGSLAESLAATRLLFHAAGSVTLAVGILGILGMLGVLNIGLATVKERAEKLALRRSLDATKGDIAFLVPAESILTGLVGAALSTLLALALFRPVTAFITDHPEDVVSHIRHRPERLPEHPG